MMAHALELLVYFEFVKELRTEVTLSHLCVFCCSLWKCSIPSFSFYRFTFPSSYSDDYLSFAPWFSFPCRNVSEIIIYGDGETSGKGRRNTKKVCAVSWWVVWDMPGSKWVGGEDERGISGTGVYSQRCCPRVLKERKISQNSVCVSECACVSGWDRNTLTSLSSVIGVC